LLTIDRNHEPINSLVVQLPKTKRTQVREEGFFRPARFVEDIVDFLFDRPFVDSRLTNLVAEENPGKDHSRHNQKYREKKNGEGYGHLGLDIFMPNVTSRLA
jgi:hypothetical protein